MILTTSFEKDPHIPSKHFQIFILTSFLNDLLFTVEGMLTIILKNVFQIKPYQRFILNYISQKDTVSTNRHNFFAT